VQVRFPKIGACHVRVAEVSLPQLTTYQNSVFKVSLHEISTLKNCTAQVGFLQVGALQVGTGQVSACQVNPSEVEAAQVEVKLVRRTPCTPMPAKQGKNSLHVTARRRVWLRPARLVFVRLRMLPHVSNQYLQHRVTVLGIAGGKLFKGMNGTYPHLQLRVGKLFDGARETLGNLPFFGHLHVLRVRGGLPLGYPPQAQKQQAHDTGNGQVEAETPGNCPPVIAPGPSGGM